MSSHTGSIVCHWAESARGVFPPITMELSLFHLTDFPGTVFPLPSPTHMQCTVSQTSDMQWDETSWHTSTILRCRSTVSQVHCLSETESSKNQSVVTRQAATILPFCFWRPRVTDGFSFLGEAHKVLSTISPEKETREPVKLRADQDFCPAWRQRVQKKARLQEGVHKGQGEMECCCLSLASGEPVLEHLSCWINSSLPQHSPPRDKRPL